MLNLLIRVPYRRINAKISSLSSDRDKKTDTSIHVSVGNYKFHYMLKLSLQLLDDLLLVF